MPGYGLRRVRFRRPVPLAEGFARAEAAIQAAGRPLTAFCACELRSPGQFSEDSFRRFNESYVDTLSRWGIYDGATAVSVGRMTLPVARVPLHPDGGEQRGLQRQHGYATVTMTRINQCQKDRLRVNQSKTPWW